MSGNKGTAVFTLFHSITKTDLNQPCVLTFKSQQIFLQTKDRHQMKRINNLFTTSLTLKSFFVPYLDLNDGLSSVIFGYTLEKQWLEK